MFKPSKGSTKKRKRVGRGNGSGWGGECGRGHKGQKSRSGYSARPGFEGGKMPLYKQMPKLKGFKPLNKIVYSVVNLSTLDKYFEENQTVNYESLRALGLIPKDAPIKVLGQGNITKPLTIEVDRISESGKKKLVDAKATIKELESNS